MAIDRRLQGWLKTQMFFHLSCSFPILLAELWVQFNFRGSRYRNGEGGYQSSGLNGGVDLVPGWSMLSAGGSA